MDSHGLQPNESHTIMRVLWLRPAGMTPVRKPYAKGKSWRRATERQPAKKWHKDIGGTPGKEARRGLPRLKPHAKADECNEITLSYRTDSTGIHDSRGGIRMGET